ncbi:MAG TPA: hypothetical protein VJS13_15350 [Pyrinomonadaceae bacterium]|nr:hypothetical protein [Pyrinomonadaceae bacterium]
MKNIAVVCLGVLVAVSVAYSQHKEVSPFAPVKRIGEPPAQQFYLFSTSVNDYTIRNDGLGDVLVRVRKKNFQLKVGVNSHIERLYFFEYQGELLLLYEAGASGYLVRFDQKSKSIKSTTAIAENFEPPLLKEQTLTFTDGTTVRLN